MPVQIAANHSVRRMVFVIQLKIDEVPEVPTDWDKIKRLVYQIEKAPSTGQIHAQGYCEFTNPTKFSVVRNKFPHGTYFDLANGSAKQNYEYCTKKDTRVSDPVETGDWSSLQGQGKRNDLHDFVVEIKKKRKFSEIVDEYPNTYVKYYKGLTKLNIMLNEKSRTSNWDEVDFRWYYGPPGSGKSYAVRDEFANVQIYEKNSANKWWDGYNADKHDVIEIQDYRDNKELKHQDLLNIMDVYPYRCEIKGDTIQLLALCVIIHSNKAPWEMFTEEMGYPEKVGPLVQRLSVYEFKNENDGFQQERVYKCVRGRVSTGISTGISIVVPPSSTSSTPVLVRTPITSLLNSVVNLTSDSDDE